MIHRADAGISPSDRASDTSGGFPGAMDKHWFSRPAVVVPGLFVVWFASAAVYAFVFSY